MRTNILKKGLILPLFAIMFAFSSVASMAQIDTSDNNDAIWFQNNWNRFAMEVNEEFAMTFTAETSLDCICPIHYELLLESPFSFEQFSIPDGIEIDEMSGLVTWVPEMPGEYYFGVRAYIEGQPEIATVCHNFIQVDRPNERPCAVINVDLVFPGTATDSLNPSLQAVVKAVPIPNPYNLEYYGELKNNGGYRIHVPAGTYDVILMLYANMEPIEITVNETPVEIECQQTENLTVNVTEDMMPDMVVFTTFPEPNRIGVGETYTYDCNAYSTKGNVVRYRLEQGPETAIFNEETGELSWSPIMFGGTVFTIIAYTENDSTVMNYQSWYMEVEREQPQLCANVFGYITTNTVNTVERGYVTAIPLFDVSDTLFIDKAFFAPINENGFYTMNLPTGEYKFYVNAYGCVPEFFNDKLDYEEADIYIIECDDSLNLSAELEAITPIEMVQVTGRVYNAETELGLNAEVRFIIQDPNWNPNEIILDLNTTEVNFDGNSFWAVTDRSGEYTINVPKNLDLKAVAVSYDWTYLQEFYNNVDQYELAQVLNFSENATGIDFSLERYQDTTFNTGFTGRVVNGEEQPIRAIVTAVRIPGEDENMDYVFENVPTNQDGEYTFNTLPYGNYIVFAMPINAPLLPGFYVENDFASWNWQEATIITLDETEILRFAEIKLRSITDMPGLGRIRGRIGRNDGGLVMGKGSELNADGIADAFVVIYDKDRKAVKHTNTNATGDFDLTNLAFGDYTVAVSKIGFDFAEQTVTIDAQNAEKVTTLQLVPVDNTLEVETELTNNNRVYPNPASSIANVVFNAAEGNVVITITTIQGEIVTSFDLNTIEGRNSISFSTNALSNGLYLIKVSGSADFQTLLNVIK